VYGILAAGRPAIFIGNERCEIAQWLAEADAGRCVRHGDVNGLVEAIRFSKSNRDEASAMGRRGRELLDERFGAQQAAEQWATLLDSVLVGR